VKLKFAPLASLKVNCPKMEPIVVVTFAKIDEVPDIIYQSVVQQNVGIIIPMFAIL
jgi:hypothetical protein